jgi:2-keto-4-pentenoate hydratase
LTQLDDRVRRGLQAQLRELEVRTAAGERRIGWKVALNDPRVQGALEIDRPVIGYLAGGTEVAAGATHSLAGATRPAVEPEIAVHIGDGDTIAGLGPALEVIDMDMAFDDLERIMAANVFHRAVVLGPVTEGPARLDGLTARFTHAEEEHSIDVAFAAMDPQEVVALVSGYLEAIGESLRPGDAIIGGSMIAALPAAHGGRFELDVDELGSVALELTPSVI